MHLLGALPPANLQFNIGHVAKDYRLEKWITPEISDGQLSVCRIDSLDASLVLTSEGIF
jgi:hypothetical protein